MTPDYEVKFLLNSGEVLSPENEFTSAVLSALNVPTTATKLNVQFLDTDSREIYKAGWSPRIRKADDDEDIELTYKKRYTIAEGGIDAALTQANQDGFDASAARYKAQVEWGYKKQTLSISRKKSVSDPGNNGIDLPGTTASQKMLVDEAPDKFVNSPPGNWTTAALNVSRIFGPISVKRWTGTWNGMELDIEVWPIRDAEGDGIEHIAEASFKTESRSVASTEYDNFRAYLDGKGWFLACDSLKTQLIMERY